MLTSMESLKQYWYEFVAAQGISPCENARRSRIPPLHESPNAPAYCCHCRRDIQLFGVRTTSIGEARHHRGRLPTVRARVRPADLTGRIAGRVRGRARRSSAESPGSV